MIGIGSLMLGGLVRGGSIKEKEVFVLGERMILWGGGGGG